MAYTGDLSAVPDWENVQNGVITHLYETVPKSEVFLLEGRAAIARVSSLIV